MIMLFAVMPEYDTVPSVTPSLELKLELFWFYPIRALTTPSAVFYTVTVPAKLIYVTPC
jgi:hypothetical protein